MEDIVEEIEADDVVVYNRFGNYSEPEYERRITLVFDPNTLKAYINGREAAIGDGDSSTSVIQLTQDDYHYFVTLGSQELIEIFL